MKSNIFLLLFILLLSPVLNAQSRWSTLSDTNNVIIKDTNRQFSLAIVKDGAAGAFVVWVDDRGTNLDIYALKIAASGEVIGRDGGKRLVGADGDQESPTIVEIKGGGFFMAWQDTRNDPQVHEIFVRKFDRDGNELWLEDALAIKGNNRPPRLITNLTGVIAAAFNTNFPNNSFSFQIINSSTGVIEFTPQAFVNQTLAGQQPNQPPAVVSGLGGGIITTWRNSISSVLAKGIKGDSSEWSAGELSLSNSTKPETNPVAVSDGNEGAIIVWLESDSPDDDIKAARLDMNGSVLWEKTVIFSGEKTNLQISPDGQNGAYLIWEKVNATASKVVIQRVNQSGDFWAADVALTSRSSNQINAQITHNAPGDALVAWQDEDNGAIDIYAQSINLAGNILWEDSTLVTDAPGAQRNPILVADGIGGAIVAWEDFRNGAQSDIFAQRVNVKGSLGEFRSVEVTAPTGNKSWEVGSSQTILWEASPEIANVKIILSCRDNDSAIIESTANDGIFIWSVSGPDSTQCRIKVQDVKTDFLSNTSEPFTIFAQEGPRLTPEIKTTGKVGETFEVTTLATDLSGINQVTLNYKMGGASVFQATNMTREDSSQFRGIVPTAFVTERGVDYFISGTDSINVQSQTDTFFVSVTFDAGVEKAEISSGSEQNFYRMISAPNLLTQTSADSIFTNSRFGAYDTTRWRLFQYRDGETVERDSMNASSFRFDLGEALWLISSDRRTIDFGSGISLPADRDTIITLNPGWNQVGNPFAFSVSWDAILNASGKENFSMPFLFTGDYSIVNKLDPYQGYFIFNYNSTQKNQTLRVPPIEFSESNPNLSRISADFDWQLQIKSRCQEARDSFNFIGIHEQASVEWDRFDQPEPPSIGDYISVYFPQENWQVYPNNYTTDYRDNLGQGQTWTFKVVTNIPNSEAKISFTGLEGLPGDLEIVLVDEKLNVTRDIRAEHRYSFPTGSSGATKSLKLVVGKSDFVSNEVRGSNLIPMVFELDQNFPNPFNPATSIRFGLPEAAKVTIKVFDLLGKQVVTLLSDEQKEAGYHVVSWGGHGKNGASVASGLYFYQIVSGKFFQTRKMLLVK